MTLVSFRKYGLLPFLGAFLLVVLFAAPRPTPVQAQPQMQARAQAQDEEPIAYIGHGEFFDRRGAQIVPTAAWVARAQGWYRRQLVADINPNLRAEFAAFERLLSAGLDLNAQESLVVQQRALVWLAARRPRTAVNGRMRSILNALNYRLNWRLPRSDSRDELLVLKPFRLNSRILERLRLPRFRPGGGPAALATANGGQAYLDECAQAQVPIPPPINLVNQNGTTGWRIIGRIPQSQQFIVTTPAEVRVFQSGNGMCIALPRYTDDSASEVMLDGVICLSRVTSKVCFWDNQWDHDADPQTDPEDFTFPATTQIPIGVPDTTVNPAGLYQAGGAEIEFGPGGRCTDCHAGENPYIIHPDANLGTAASPYPMRRLAIDFPTFAPNRYEPLVGASWPQNQFSHPESTVPGPCVGCHQQPSAGGTAGRFPHLSSGAVATPGDLSGYCRTVLSGAVEGIIRDSSGNVIRTVPPTMPPSNPGTLATNQAVIDFRAWCDVAATGDPSDRGDPHLTTTNGINYDFQAAGEFTALRNSSNGFELQTRQTPVLTSFTPGANPYTGLASCVSLNTAVALRAGRHRISYQPVRGERAATEQMQLRIDGRLVTLPARGLTLSGGDLIAPGAGGGGFEVRLADGTRLAVTPNYWASEGYWYLNIEVLGTPAREGTMGHIGARNWLPFRPDGGSFGPAPASIAGRHSLLNGLFADAWRVTDASSLFDYAPGTSTATFTNRGWPPFPGSTCTALRGNSVPGGQPRRPVQPMEPERARALCRPIADRAAYQNCVFDLTATGDPGMAEAYLRTLRLRSPVLPPRRAFVPVRPRSFR